MDGAVTPPVVSLSTAYQIAQGLMGTGGPLLVDIGALG